MEVKLRKDSSKENNVKTQQLISDLKTPEDIHLHPNIILYLMIKLFFISISIIFTLYCKFIHPIARNLKFSPIRQTEIELPIVKKTEKPQPILQPLHPSVNTISA